MNFCKVGNNVFLIATLIWSGCAKPAPPVGNSASAPDTNSGLVSDPLMDGDAFSQQGDTDTAIRHYSEAIRANPARAEAYVRRGAAYSHTGRRAKPVDDYT